MLVSLVQLLPNAPYNPQDHGSLTPLQHLSIGLTPPYNLSQCKSITGDVLVVKTWPHFAVTLFSIFFSSYKYNFLAFLDSLGFSALTRVASLLYVCAVQHGSHQPWGYWALEMWLDQIEMCCKYKMDTRFWRLRTIKKCKISHYSNFYWRHLETIFWIY